MTIIIALLLAIAVIAGIWVCGFLRVRVLLFALLMIQSLTGSHFRASGNRRTLWCHDLRLKTDNWIKGYSYP